MSKEALDMIKKELQVGQVDELYLDDLPIITITPELKKEIEKLPDLACLSMNNCSLSSLNNFPTKPALIRLELMENKFPAKDLVYVASVSALQSLSLGSNKIATIADLAPLKKLTNLIQLDLSDTELSKTADYRKSVFELIPNLQVLDNLDVEGNEYEYSSEDDMDEDGADGSDNDDEEGDEEDDDEGENDESGEFGDDDDEEDEDDEDEGIQANKRRK